MVSISRLCSARGQIADAGACERDRVAKGQARPSSAGVIGMHQAWMELRRESASDTEA